MNIPPIQNEADYLAALKTVSPWFDKEPDPGTEDAILFTALIALIQAYEAQHYPI